MDLETLTPEELQKIIDFHTDLCDRKNFVICEFCKKIKWISREKELYEINDVEYTNFCSRCEAFFPSCCILKYIESYDHIKQDPKYKFYTGPMTCFKCKKEKIEDVSKLKVEYCVIYYDGSSKNNKSGGASAVLYINDKEIEAKALHLENVTNNEAEYLGLNLAAILADKHKTKRAKFIGDSKLVTMQMKGKWKTNKQELFDIQKMIRIQLKNIHCEFEWIPREQNKRADQICYAAMKSQELGDKYTLPQKTLCRPK